MIGQAVLGGGRVWHNLTVESKGLEGHKVGYRNQRQLDFLGRRHSEG